MRTFIDLEFGTGTADAKALGDIATSLVTIDELLRDLGSMAAYPDSAEFRNIEIVAIQMRSPLTIKLSLLAISADAVTAFQELCRELILARERPERHGAQHPANIPRALGLCGPEVHARITPNEAQRLHELIATLARAEVPLTRVEVKKE